MVSRTTIHGCESWRQIDPRRSGCHGGRGLPGSPSLGAEHCASTLLPSSSSWNFVVRRNGKTGAEDTAMKTRMGQQVLWAVARSPPMAPPHSAATALPGTNLHSTFKALNLGCFGIEPSSPALCIPWCDHGYMTTYILTHILVGL